MTTLETLKAARAKIAEESNWTQMVLARDGNAIPVAVTSPNATSWCLDGALQLVSDEDESYKAYLFLCSLVPDPVYFNDNHTHAEVLALFDKAIAELEGGAK